MPLWHTDAISPSVPHAQKEAYGRSACSADRRIGQS